MITTTASTTEAQPFYLAGEQRVRESHVLVTAPYDDAVLGKVATADRDDALAALGRAEEALERGLAPYERADILDRAAAQLAQQREDLASVLSNEVGKPIALARAEVERAVATFTISASVARTAAPGGVTMDATAAGTGKIGYLLRIPAGVVAAITPFNFPLNLVAHKLAPAIAAGCPVVLKPAPQAPLTALALARTLYEAGLPGDFLSVLPGFAEEIGSVLTTDPRVDVITFTGSTRVGWMLRAAAPSKKVLLELGNSAPAIVHRDADLDSAAAKITAGAFGFAGQSCVSVQRVYAHRSVVEELQDILVAKAGAVETGSPANEKVLTGPVIDDAARDRLTSWMDQAVSAGARLLVGGDVDGRVIEPTILADIPADQPLAQEEAFGPVYGLAAYDDIEDAYAASNGTRFALQASVFTNNLRVALDATRRLKFGGVLVNEAPTFRTDAMPYGGGKDSGNTKEGPASTVAELTEERLVVIDQSATPSHT